MGASTHQSPRQRRADGLAYVARCLTERDRQIVEAVARFDVFTAEQIAEMFFDSLKRAQVRLQRLHALRVLDRFQPYRAGWGSSPYHYMLGPNGTAIVDADRRPDSSTFRRGRALALGQRSTLDRLTTLNGLYASLLSEARRCAVVRLDWMVAAEATAWSDGIVSPDAFGRWHDGDQGVEFFIITDTGGTWAHDLARRVSSYERFEAERGASAWLLAFARTVKREQVVRAALGNSPISVATSSRGSTGQWWPIGPGNSRVPLCGLPPSRRVPPGRLAWRYETFGPFEPDRSLKRR